MAQAFTLEAVLWPIGLLVAIFALGGFAVFYRHWHEVRSARRDDIHACAKCGYDLSGAPKSPICPECGHVRERMPR